MADQKNKTTKELIEEEIQLIRQWIQQDGGDVMLESFENGIVTLVASGHCVGCGFFDTTYTTTIKPLLMEKFPEVKDVVVKMAKTVW